MYYNSIIKLISQFLGLLGCFVALGFLWLFDTITATLTMITMLCFYAILRPDRAMFLLLASIVGAISDLSLNLYFTGERATDTRGQKLRIYFDELGSLDASIFAACITAWLLLAALDFLEFTKLRPRWFPVVGFVTGAFFGVIAEKSRALQPLLPYYESTSGQLENRAWDGLSTAVASTIILITGFLPQRNQTN